MEFKMNFFLILNLLFSPLAFSSDHGHSLGAHEHGSIKVGIAIEGQSAEVEIDGPAESFLGFEHAPKSKLEIKTFKDAQQKWTQKFDSLLSFDKKLNCRATTASFEQEKSSGSHSDIEASAKIQCASKIAGSSLSVSMKKEFKNIKKLSIEIIGSDSKSIEVTKEVQIINL